MALLSARLKVGRLDAMRLRWIGADTIAPTAPASLTATPYYGVRVDLSWAASSDFYGIASYEIQRCTGAGCTDFVAIYGNPGHITTQQDVTVKPSTTYRYRVIAIDATGNRSAPSPIATVTTGDAINIAIKVGGVWTDVGPYVRVAGASITQALNEVIDTATFTINGSIPYALKGTEIGVWDIEGVTLFAGYITAVRTIYEGRAANLAYECDCLDYTWVFNSKRITKRYTATHATSIFIDLITSFAPTFGLDLNLITTNVLIDEITFTNEELGQAFSRVCERAGWYWFVDYLMYVRVYESANYPSAGTIDQTNPRESSKLAKHEDFVPIVTRVRARGGGAAAASDIPAGATSMPVEDASWYHPGGGLAESGPQQFQYVGVSDPGTGALVGEGNAPSSAPSVAAALGSNLAAGLAYQYAVTFTTSAGETLPGPRTTYIPAGGSIGPAPAPVHPADVYDQGIAGGSMVPGGSYRWAWEKYITGGARVAGTPSAPITVTGNYWRLRIPHELFAESGVAGLTPYRTTNGGSVFYADNATQLPGSVGYLTTGDRTDTDLAFGGTMGGGSGASYLAAALTIPTSPRPGVTGRKIYRTVANGSTLKLLATIANNTATTYADTTADGSLGADAPTTDTSAILGGGQINAGASAILVSTAAPFAGGGGWVRVANMVLRYTSISGASLVLAEPLPATLSYGTEILNAPTLTGIPASGATSIRYAIKRGDEVYVYAVRDDAAAIAALAAATGTDGIREELLTDGRLSLTELVARADALLVMRKSALVTVTFETRDREIRVGRTVTFNTTSPPIVGTFLIQRVQIGDMHARGSLGKVNPLRRVECSSRRYTFDDLVQQIKLLGRIN